MSFCCLSKQGLIKTGLPGSKVTLRTLNCDTIPIHTNSLWKFFLSNVNKQNSRLSGSTMFFFNFRQAPQFWHNRKNTGVKDERFHCCGVFLRGNFQSKSRILCGQAFHFSGGPTNAESEKCWSGILWLGMFFGCMGFSYFSEVQAAGTTVNGASKEVSMKIVFRMERRKSFLCGGRACMCKVSNESNTWYLPLGSCAPMTGSLKAPPNTFFSALNTQMIPSKVSQELFTL